ncbi:thioredoxin family protein [Turicibacter sanguinis]
MMLLYFKGSQCSACLALLPKVGKIIEQYPEIEMRIIDVNKDAEISSHFGVYSVPATILFIEGKEYIKEAGIFSIHTLNEKINRLYEMIYK